jgi:hypothetical protein
MAKIIQYKYIKVLIGEVVRWIRLEEFLYMKDALPLQMGEDNTPIESPREIIFYLINSGFVVTSAEKYSIGIALLLKYGEKYADIIADNVLKEINAPK